MARVGSKNTKPEMLVRRALHRLGFRFRLHRRDLPGRPDIVLPKYKTAIFVHGCFWHRHPGCRRTTIPKTREAFWLSKFEANISRDRKATEALERDGWKVLVLWECEIAASSVLADVADQLRRPTSAGGCPANDCDPAQA
jgi:DNA mismatch endonuclease (patch repair protein)